MQFKERLYDGLEKMLSYRVAIGYSSGSTHKRIISHFIEYCCASFGDSTCITKEMVNSYLAKWHSRKSIFNPPIHETSPISRGR